MAVDNTCLSLGTQDLTCCSWNAIRPLLSSSSARNSSRSWQELLVWRRKRTGAQLWKKELGLIVLIRVPNLPDVSRRTGGGCPGRRPLMTATWGSICSEVDIDGTCICFSTCVTITGNYWLFVQHLPHVEDTDWCSRSLHPAHFCVIHQHNSRTEQDQNEAEI